MTKHPTPNMSQPTSSTFKVGDRVRITAEFPSAATGKSGRIVSDTFGVFVVRVDGIELDMAYDADEMAPAATVNDLIAIVEALGAVEHNSWIDAGLLCRRYITSDGSIDLTVRVP